MNDSIGEYVQTLGIVVLLFVAIVGLFVAFCWAAYGVYELFAWLDFNPMPPNPRTWGD
jgi:hypothetical protein